MMNGEVKKMKKEEEENGEMKEEEENGKMKEEEENEERKEEEDGEMKKNEEMDAKLKELSLINSKINRMNVPKLRDKAKSLKLSQHGTREILKTRIKKYYQAQKLGLPQEQPTSRDEARNRREREKASRAICYEYFIVIDYEATCDQNDFKYRHEIIEFPAILVDTKKMKVVGEFHSYVKPLINTKLTDFCTQLTGITQDKVNSAPTFPTVLERFEAWLLEKNLIGKGTNMNTFAVLTDGPWDMGRFLNQQCKISDLPFPKWGKHWINIRKTYSNFYKTRKMSLSDMLDRMGMKFIGQPHCGRDDANNIARVAISLAKDGASMKINEVIAQNKQGEYYVKSVTKMSRVTLRKRLKNAKMIVPGQEEEEEEEEDDQDEDEDSGNHQVVEKDEDKFEDAKASFDTEDETEFPTLK